MWLTSSLYFQLGSGSGLDVIKYPTCSNTCPFGGKQRHHSLYFIALFMINFIEENCHFRLSNALYRKGHSYKPHSHKDTAISIVLNGIVHEKVDNKLEIGKSAVTIIKPAEIIHQNIFTEDCTILCLYLKNIRKNKLKHSDILEEWTWMSGLNCIPYFINILQSKDEKQIHESIADLLRYISFCKTDSTVTNMPSWLADAKAYIDTYYDEPVNVTALAKKYKVHRVYLARVFNKYFGQNIKSYLKSLRIHHSVASLINGTSINDTAFVNGYSDQSHLQRNFKQQLQQTPLEFQNLFK
ncbi:MAG: helix-turn-helix transcriptional regulator [Chitinophagaceae bacterium]|nr:helix-turn-helix transcriptional regulator [Chitinophagaceae bacterium]